MKKRKYTYLCLTIPAAILIIWFIFIPLLNAANLSFFRWNGYSQNKKWINIENFTKAFSDKMFWRCLVNTLIYGFGSCALQNLCGLFAALFLNKKFMGRNAVRVVLYMPIMISAFIMGQIMYYFFQFDGGVFNEVLNLFGVSDVYWMKNGWTAVILITFVNSWQYMGLCMIIYLAGLQNIPAMYREAARLDGANKFYEFIHITLPLLIPAITTAVVTNLIGGFKMFDVIVSMTGGGPSKQSMSLSYYISTLYFTDERAGYASAIGVILFALIIVITLPVNAWLRKKEVEY